MQRSLVWKKLGDLLNGVIMTAVWMTGVWRRRVDNQAYIRNYPRLGTPVAVEAGEGAEGSISPPRPRACMSART